MFFDVFKVVFVKKITNDAILKYLGSKELILNIIIVSVNIKDQAKPICAAVLLAIKITSKFFFTNVYVCRHPVSFPSQDNCYGKVGV